ncbi:uncharacterized protein LOC100829478 [Brachypodium distachyon]|nr:uncharacterized protein LOC100829478 [Brachypodium distachyon]|eukprot:XP_024314556.1 uncharacterized protein LOC100829478 [Brachypodium distachyon]
MVLVLVRSGQGICQIVTKKMSNRSSRDKNKVSDTLYGEDVDPAYKMFLDHLSKDGDSYVLHVPNGDHGMPVTVRYEVANDKDGTDTPNISPCISQGGVNIRRPGVTSAGAANVSVGQSITPRTSSLESKTSEIDESYAKFLSLTKMVDGFMVTEIEPGVTIVYEQEEETPAAYGELKTVSDTPVRVYSRRTVSSRKERAPLTTALENMEEEDEVRTDEDRLEQTDNRHNVISKESHYPEACEDDQGAPLGLPSGVTSTFDEQLDSFLSRPYDRNEFQELLRKATFRKPVTRQRHLRNASKFYATGELGLSYLDEYPDLATQIDSADCDERRLNLLRKFFFWLQNLTQEGAYMPWIPKAPVSNPINVED